MQTVSIMRITLARIVVSIRSVFQNPVPSDKAGKFKKLVLLQASDQESVSQDLRNASRIVFKRSDAKVKNNYPIFRSEGKERRLVEEPCLKSG